jgi:hypothetical protein
MDRAKRKEKQRLKRMEKQRELRRIHSITPLRRICSGGGTLECWVNSNWRATGMANLLVLGQAGSGQYALAAFLIDIWCVGLKDAWGNADYSRLDFDQMLKRAKERMPMVRIDTDAARRLVAGGIRFARHNGFRLPPDSDRWTAMLGDLGDIGIADLADFGKDGKLLYVGDRQFLAQRLNGMSVEQFMQRPDVDWTMEVGREIAEQGFAADPEQFQEYKEGLLGATDRGVAVVSEWCRQNNQEPHPQLREAMMVFLASSASTRGVGGTPEQMAQVMGQNIGRFLKSGLVQDPRGHLDAVSQILEAMKLMGPEMFERMQESPEEDQPAKPDVEAAPA